MLDEETRKKENAKRQDEYRKRNIKEGTDQRLNVILDQETKLALERMAKHYGVTNKELLNRVLLAAQKKLVASLDDTQKVEYYK